MRVIEIREDKVSSLAECVEKMLRYGGKAMQCIEAMQGGENERGRRSEYGERWDDDDEERYDRMRIEGDSRYGNGRYSMRRYR